MNLISPHEGPSVLLGCRQLKQYRPFLPESLFLEEETKVEEPTREDSTSLVCLLPLPAGKV